MIEDIVHGSIQEYIMLVLGMLSKKIAEKETLVHSHSPPPPLAWMEQEE